MFCCCHPCHRNSFGRQSKARCSLHLSGSGSPPPSCFAPWLLISLCLYTAVAPYLSHPGSRPTTDKAEFIFPPRLPRQRTSIPGSQISKKEESRTLVSGFFLLLLFVFFKKQALLSHYLYQRIFHRTYRKKQRDGEPQLLQHSPRSRHGSRSFTYLTPSLRGPAPRLPTATPPLGPASVSRPTPSRNPPKSSSSGSRRYNPLHSGQSGEKL